MKKSTAALVTTALVAVAALLIVVLVVRISGSDTSKSKIGGATFDVGPATRLIKNTPFLFSDLRGGDLDVWVQHTGGDINSGWTTFLAHTPDSRTCGLSWHKDTKTFTDCHAATYPVDGGAAPHYATAVDKHGHVVVDFTRD